MPAVVYYIDPLLTENLGFHQDAFANALSDLAASLPDYEHLALSFVPGMTMEEDERVKLLSLVIPKVSIRSQAQNRARAFEAWKGDRNDILLVQFSPALWLTSSGIPTWLITSFADTQTAAARKTTWNTATAITVPWEQDRLELAEQRPDLASRLSVIYPALEDKVESLGWAGQEQVKLKYSGGRDYLLFAGPLAESSGLIHLLKSYSLFKNWLLTGMPLVLAGPSTEDTPALEAKLSTYKYKNDVLLFPDIDTADLQDLTAGAYVLVYPRATGYDQPIQWAFSAGTAVVAANDLRLREWTDTAIETAEENDPNLLGNTLMVLYKDEDSRTRLIEKGRDRANALQRSVTLTAYAAVVQRFLGNKS